MNGPDPGGQRTGATRTSTLLQALALVGGVVLIVAGKASPAEAAGYVSPFLAAYGRAGQRR